MVDLFYDLHIHSALSPCGHEDMTPANIVLMAKLKGLQVIALTDHNSAKNCPAFLYHAQREGIIGIPGMELCTSEEVHVLCLFYSLEDAMRFDEYVTAHMIAFPNREEIFGAQSIIDIDDNIVGKVDNLLINATTISFDEVYDLMKDFHGVMIPAHIDKGSNSVIANLGFIPPDSKFHTIELSKDYKGNPFIEEDSYAFACKRIINSDAHYLEHIKEAIEFLSCEEESIRGVLNVLR